MKLKRYPADSTGYGFRIKSEMKMIGLFTVASNTVYRETASDRM